MAIPRRAAQCLASLSRTQIRGYSDAPTWVATQHTLRVAPWDGFESMSYVYATARELEKRFGPIDHIKVPRDPETHSYRGYAWMTFREPLPVSTEGGLPNELQSIVVKKPSNDVNRPGGPGLDDFDGLLESGGKRPESEWTKLKDAEDAALTDSAYLDVRLELSSNSLKLKPTSSRHISADLEKSIARSFDMFTGFASEPTPSMEAIQKKWSKHLPPKPASSKASSSQQTESQQSQEAASADELPQMDPLADYLEAYKDLKVEEPHRVVDPPSASLSHLSKTAEAESIHPTQVNQVQELREGLGLSQGEVVPSVEGVQIAGTTQSHEGAESLSQHNRQSNQRHSHRTQTAASRSNGKHARQNARSSKSSKKDALLAAARNAGKRAEQEKLKPKRNFINESSTPEDVHQETEPDLPSEPSTGLQSRIFSMFKRS